MPIRYAPDAFFSLLEAQGVPRIYPTRASEAGSPSCCVHPVPERVPANLLLQENINYALACLESNIPLENRRVAFLVHLNGRWIGLALNLTGLHAEKAAAIQKNLNRTNRKTVASLPSILQDRDLITLFRELYQSIQCVFLGLFSQVPEDVNIVRGQFIPLIQQAYAAQGMQALFLEQAHADSPDVVFLQDLVTVLKGGVFEGQQIQNRIIALRDSAEQQVAALFKQQNQAVIAHLVEAANAIIAAAGEAEATVTALATALLLCVKRLRLLDHVRQNLDPQIGRSEPSLIKTNYLQAKAKIYNKTNHSRGELLTIALSNLDINNLLKLMQAEPANRIALLSQGLAQFNQQLLTEIKAWQSKLQTLPLLSRRQVWQTGLQGLGTLYQATLVPVYATLFATAGGLLNEALEGIPHYTQARHGVERGLHAMTRIAIYGLTMSDALSRQGADALIGPHSARMALQLSGGIFGFYCAYTLGLPVFISTASFLLLNQTIHSYTQQPSLNDETATAQANRLSVLTPQAISRVIGLAILSFELMITGNMRHAAAYFGGLLGSILAVYSMQPGQPVNQEDHKIAFLASMSGQQLGQSLVYLALATLDAFTLKNQQRQAFVNHLQGLMIKGEIENVEVTLPSFWTNPRTWVTDSNPVQASFHNRSSGFFTRIACDIQTNSSTCEITQIGTGPKIG